MVVVQHFMTVAVAGRCRSTDLALVSFPLALLFLFHSRSLIPNVPPVYIVFLTTSRYSLAASAGAALVGSDT